MDLKFEIIQPGTGNYDELYTYLKEIDHTHVPSISSRVNLEEWTRKLIDHATLFVYRDNGKLVACVADYVNKAPEYTFGTHLSAKHEYADYLLGPDLIRRSLKYARQYGSAGKVGKIRSSFKALVEYYFKLGFVVINKSVFPNSNVEELEIILTF
ncbi:MAG: hypothetical protein HDR80_09670 [Bacteroides sp.]|nr:hypothetical protein [Bacteroides sp.]